MKRRWILLLSLCLLTLGSPKTQAQFQVGGGVFFETWFQNAGLDLRAQYEVFDAMFAVAKLDICFPDFNYGYFRMLNELSLHAHYMLLDDDMIGLYPLAGVSVINYFSVDPSPVNVNFNLAFGLSAGAGGVFKISDNLNFFGEARYTLSRYHRFMATAGVLYTLGGKKGDSGSRRDAKNGSANKS